MTHFQPYYFIKCSFYFFFILYTCEIFFKIPCDMWHMVGGEHYFKMSAPQLLRFGIDSVLKDHLLNQPINQWINQERCSKNSLGFTGSVLLFLQPGGVVKQVSPLSLNRCISEWDTWTNFEVFNIIEENNSMCDI